MVASPSQHGSPDGYRFVVDIALWWISLCGGYRFVVDIALWWISLCGGYRFVVDIALWSLLLNHSADIYFFPGANQLMKQCRCATCYSF